MSENIQTVWLPKGADVLKGILKMKEKYGIGELKAIEFYAGDGHTLSNQMSEQCGSFVAYDIDPLKEDGFKKNVANGEFRLGDSVKMMITLNEGELGNYNLISADAPICIYGEDYCEHFEILNYVYKLVPEGEKAVCVFPVVPKPYDTEKKENAEWMRRRGAFYKTEDKNLDLEKAIVIYNDIFKRQGFQVMDSLYICREYRNGIDWMYEFVYVLCR